MTQKRLHTGLDHALFLGPALLVSIPFVILPFFYTIYISLTEWNGISNASTFIGFANYVRVLTKDADFRNAVFFTFRLTAAATIGANVIGLLFALILAKNTRTNQAGRLLLLLPNMLSGVILGYIWRFIFTKAIPAYGDLTGLSFLNGSWLSSPDTSFLAIVIVCLWQWVGYTMIIYVAGINSIGDEVWEAARLDGPGPIRQFFSVTLPLIMPSVTICLFWTIVHGLTMFDLVFTLTGGAPYRSTDTITMNLYNEAFARNNYGRGSAKAILFFIIAMLVSRLQVYITNKQEVEL